MGMEGRLLEALVILHTDPPPPGGLRALESDELIRLAWAYGVALRVIGDCGGGEAWPPVAGGEAWGEWTQGLGAALGEQLQRAVDADPESRPVEQGDGRVRRVWKEGMAAELERSLLPVEASQTARFDLRSAAPLQWLWAHYPDALALLR